MLTDVAVRQAKAKDKPYKISDSSGLYLLVNSTGKYWRMNYRFAGKQKTLAIGVYPAVSLVDARKKRDEAKDQLANCLVPQCTGVIYSHLRREDLWDRFCTEAPRLRTRSERQYSDRRLRSKS